MSPTGPRLAAAALTVALALTASACSGDDDSGATDDPTSQTSASGTPTSTSDEPSDDTSTQADPSVSATPAVAPATGIELTQTVAAVNAPADWKPDDALVDYASVARGPGSYDSLMLVDRPSFSSADTIESLYDSYVKLNKGNKDLTYERRPDVDLSGTTASVVFSTTKGSASQDYEITAVHGGRVISLILSLDKKTLQQEPQIVESVLASVHWLD